jgi:hypothetical protein
MVVITVLRSLGGKDSEWLDMKIGWVTQRNTTVFCAETVWKERPKDWDGWSISKWNLQLIWIRISMFWVMFSGSLVHASIETVSNKCYLCHFMFTTTV